jgi:hypothetical protein
MNTRGARGIQMRKETENSKVNWQNEHTESRREDWLTGEGKAATLLTNEGQKTKDVRNNTSQTKRQFWWRLFGGIPEITQSRQGTEGKLRTPHTTLRSSAVSSNVHGTRYKMYLFYVGFQVLTAMVAKSPIFWDTKPRSPKKVNRRFRWTSSLHLQGWGGSQTRNQHETGCKHSKSLLLVRPGSLSEPMGTERLDPNTPFVSIQHGVSAHHLFCLPPTSCFFLAWLTLQSRRWRRLVPPKRRFIFNWLWGIIYLRVT